MKILQEIQHGAGLFLFLWSQNFSRTNCQIQNLSWKQLCHEDFKFKISSRHKLINFEEIFVTHLFALFFASLRFYCYN